MSEMIEHIAKALFDASVMKDYGCAFPWDGIREEDRDEYRFSARVFMKALQDKCPQLFLPNTKEENVEPVIVMAPSSQIFDFIDYATQFDITKLAQEEDSLPPVPHKATKPADTRPVSPSAGTPSIMIERVAKAICGAFWEMSDEEWDGLHADSIIRCHAILQARAAIEAMREPDEEMIDAGVRADWGGTLGSRVAISYRDMIDEALK